MVLYQVLVSIQNSRTVYVPSVTGGAAYLARTRAAFPRPRQTRILCIQKQKLYSKTIYQSKVKNVHLRRAHVLNTYHEPLFNVLNDVIALHFILLEC